MEKVAGIEEKSKGKKMDIWLEIKASDVDIEMLAHVIREAGRPVHVNKLAWAFVRTRLLAEAREVRRYNPNATYVVGDQVRWKGKLGKVESVEDGMNPKQGQFKILTLALPDGEQIRLAAEVGERAGQDKSGILDHKIRAIVNGKYGLEIRTTIRNAMDKDERFVWFEDAVVREKREAAGFCWRS